MHVHVHVHALMYTQQSVILIEKKTELSWVGFEPTTQCSRQVIYQLSYTIKKTHNNIALMKRWRERKKLRKRLWLSTCSVHLPDPTPQVAADPSECVDPNRHSTSEFLSPETTRDFDKLPLEFKVR